MKKLCSIFLVLTLLLTLVPTMVPTLDIVADAATGDTILVEEDFSEGFTLNQAYTGAEMEALSDLNFVSNMPANHWPDKTSAYLTVKPIDADDSTKGNYLEIGGDTAEGRHAIVMADFEDIKTGTLVTEMKIRVRPGNRQKDYNALVGVDDSVKITAFSTNAGDDGTKIWPGGIFPKWGVVFATDSNEFISIKTVWYRENETDNWSVDIYDMILDRKLYSYTGAGTDLTVDSTFVPTKIIFFKALQYAAWSHEPVDLADLKVYIPGDVTITKASDYVHSKKSISFTPSKALDASTVNSATVKVKSTDGTEIPATASYANGVVTVKTDSFLKEGGSFVATLNGAKTTEGYAVYGADCAFDVAKAGKIVLVDEDFSEGFELDRAYTGAQMEELSDLNFVTNVPAGSLLDETTAFHTVKAIDANDSAKGYYLEIGNHSDNRHAVVAADFEDVKTGTLVTEMKIRVNDGQRNKTISGLTGTDGSCKSVAYSAAGSVWTGDVFPLWQHEFGKKDGFNSIKAVWHREKETDNWSVDLYDMVKGEKRPSQTVESTFIPSGALFLYAFKDPSWTDAAIDVADLKVYIPAEVTLEEKDEYNSSTKSVSFNVSEDLVASTVTSETVILTDDAGDVVAVTPAYADGVLTLTTTSILAKGEYTVTLNGVKTVSDGIELNGVACTFVADVKGDIILVDEDFSTGFEVGTAYTGAQMENLTDLQFTTAGIKDTYPDRESAYLTVKAIDSADASKGNYLEIGDHLDGKNAVITADFDDVTVGTLVTEMKVRSYGNVNRPKNYNGLFASDGSWKTTAYGSDSGSDATKVWSGGIFPKWRITFSKDNDGFNHIKAVWYRAKATDNWSVDLYDMFLGQKVLSYTGEGTDQTIDSSFVPSGAMFINAYKDATWSDAPIDVAALKAYIPAEISLEQKGEYNFGKNSISFTPSAELSASTITQETVTLKDEKGETIAITPSYANGALTIKTAKRLANGKYTVTVNGVKAADGRTLNNVIYTFTINVTGNIILVDEDFSEGFEVGTAYTGAQMENLTDLQFTTAGIKDTYPDRESAYLTVKAIDSADASKGNYLEIGDHLDGKNAVITADFDDVTVGTLVTEMKVRSYGNVNRPKNYNGLFASDGSWKTTAYGSDSGSDATKVWSGGIFPKWRITFSKDNDGFNHIKAVWYRAKATDNWSVDLYDMFLGQKVLSYTGEGTDQTIDSSFVPSGAMFINAYKDATWSDAPIDVAALKAYIVPVDQDYAVENIVCSSNDAEIEAITSNMTEITAKADVYTKAANESFTAVLAIYNGERLAAVQSFDGVSNAAGVCEVSLELTGLDLIDGATAKVFLWDSITSMKPLLGAAEVLPKAGF